MTSSLAHHTTSLVNFIPDKFNFKMGSKSLTEMRGIRELASS